MQMIPPPNAALERAFFEETQSGARDVRRLRTHGSPLPRTTRRHPASSRSAQGAQASLSRERRSTRCPSLDARSGCARHRQTCRARALSFYALGFPVWTSDRVPGSAGTSCTAAFPDGAGLWQHFLQRTSTTCTSSSRASLDGHHVNGTLRTPACRGAAAGGSVAAASVHRHDADRRRDPLHPGSGCITRCTSQLQEQILPLHQAAPPGSPQSQRVACRHAPANADVPIGAVSARPRVVRKKKPLASLTLHEAS